MTYESYRATHPSRPTITVGFNAGLSSYPWSPALKLLAAEGTPSVITSLSAEEAVGDADFARQLGLDLKWAEETNIWRGGRRRLDTFDSEGWWGDSVAWLGFGGE